MKPLIYIAGPYTNGDVIQNVRTACEAWRHLWETGRCTPICPHWTMLQHFYSPMQVDQWYAYDRAVLARCDALVRLPGHSGGAQMEVSDAEALGLKVFFTLESCITWLLLTPTAPAPNSGATA